MTQRPTGRPRLLVTDVDGTLLGDDPALAELLAAIEEAGGPLLALNSSRPVGSVRRTLGELPLRLDPVAIIGAMGTEVVVGDAFVPALSASYGGWDREPVDALMARLGYVPHADEFQTPLKASFAVPRAAWRDVERAVAGAGIDATLVGSGDSDLDVLPPGADKGAGTAFLAKHLGIPPAHVVVAGDSANDAAMFAVAGCGIVVGNAREELRRLVPRGTYRAAAAHAAGILEGLRHLAAPGGCASGEAALGARRR